MGMLSGHEGNFDREREMGNIVCSVLNGIYDELIADEFGRDGLGTHEL